MNTNIKQKAKVNYIFSEYIIGSGRVIYFKQTIPHLTYDLRAGRRFFELKFAF